MDTHAVLQAAKAERLEKARLFEKDRQEAARVAWYATLVQAYTGRRFTRRRRRAAQQQRMLVRHLRQGGYEGEYLGVDLLPEMISAAEMRHPGESFMCRDLIADPLAEPYDVTVVCGTLSQPSGVSPSRLLRSLWQCTHETLVAIVLRDGATIEDDFCHFSPTALAQLARPLSRFYTLRHDFLTTDSALIVHRRPDYGSLPLSNVDVAGLYLEVGEVAAALEVLSRLQPEERDAQYWYRRGQACRLLEENTRARRFLLEALSREELPAARLLLDGLPHSVSSD